MSLVRVWRHYLQVKVLSLIVAILGVPVQSMQKVPLSCACKINDLESCSIIIFNEINTLLCL
jgi:hypothetical protein